MVSGPSPPLHLPGKTCCPVAGTDPPVLAALSGPTHVVLEVAAEDLAVLLLEH